MPGQSPSRGRWTERYPLARLRLLGDILAAAGGTALAILLRAAIDQQLPSGLPFLTFFPLVILTAFVLGTRAGVLTTIFSGVAAWYLFLDPVNSWALSHNGRVAMLFFLFITGTQVALVHWMQRANRLLVVEREANIRLAKTRELLFRELQHRVSNNLQMVGALLTVQRRQLTDESARAALDEAARRLQTIGRISRQLYNPAGGNQKLGSFLDQLARDVIETSTTLPIRHSIIGEPDASVTPEAAIPLALVIAESIANAIEHGFSEGQRDAELQIRLQPLVDHGLAVEVEDNGRGLPEGFNLERSDSIGLRIASMLAGQLGGKFTLLPASAGGALARLELPLEAT